MTDDPPAAAARKQTPKQDEEIMLNITHNEVFFHKLFNIQYPISNTLWNHDSGWTYDCPELWIHSVQLSEVFEKMMFPVISLSPWSIYLMLTNLFTCCWFRDISDARSESQRVNCHQDQHLSRVPRRRPLGCVLFQLIFAPDLKIDVF